MGELGVRYEPGREKATVDSGGRVIVDSSTEERHFVCLKAGLACTTRTRDDPVVRAKNTSPSW
jgi:hypothetical protein